MRNLVIFAFLSMPWVGAQNGRSSQQQQQEHNGNGWDIRLAVPGDPGSDYPTLSAIPRTSFSCAGREPGYYADLETNCQVFRVCTVGSTYGFQSFLCPNGTLFNQAVFVCDWWMHVNCEKQHQLFNNNMDKFGNLKLGPQLMKDIKKMLTHPMRNPYDKTETKGSLVMMQDYKPPSGQLFPNGALLASPERAPSNVYVPTKQTQQSFGQNVLSASDNALAASTPSPQYIPAAFNTIQPTRQTETFQRQNGQYLQNNRLQSTLDNKENIISNGHAGRLTQLKNADFSYNNDNSNSQISRPIQNFIQRNSQYSQKHIDNIGTTQSYNAQNTIGSHRNQLNQQNSRYTENMSSQSNNGKQFELSTKQQYNYDSNQNNQPQTTKPSNPQFSNEIIGQVGTEAKENLVSNNDLPSTVITKTVEFSKSVKGSKPGNPKSRITFKTWIVKPSKSAKLVAEPTPYSYNRPTKNKIPIDQTTSQVYNTPPTLSQLGRLISNPNTKPYIYNKPTTAAKLIFSTNGESLQPISTPISSTRPTLSGQFITNSTITSPTTTNSRFYLAPTTFKPATRYYTNSEILQRQYLTPYSTPQTTNYQSAELSAGPTTPSPVFMLPNIAINENSNKPSFSLIQHSHINAYHNNLTFAEILTKEKLDITVNNIVKDTSDLLKTASPEEFGRLRQEPKPENNYLTPDSNSNESDETFSLTPTVPSRSSRIITSPSTDLEPPFESYNNKNINQLSNLPFFKEPAVPTIERTVSLKISIPEKLAMYLFKNQSDSAYDRLEILNTGSSNYLVLTNKLTKPRIPSFIPIGRLIVDKNSSISDSQALVFSFLADSINIAKEYNNFAQQSVISAPTQTQFQNVNNEELSRITNKISQLTSSQYTQNNNLNNNVNRENIASSHQLTTNSPIQNNGIIKYKNTFNQAQLQNAKYKLGSSQLNNQGEHVSRVQSNINVGNLNFQTSTTPNPVFSGQLYQLPVPDVTSQIYNSQISEKLIQPNNIPRQNTEVTDLQQNVNRNINNNHLEKPTSAEVEIVQSQSLPVPSPAKLQAAPNEEYNSLNSQENSAPSLFSNFLDTNGGISAQIQDKIVGTIPHPLENNKLVTYNKDQSYYVYTNLNNKVLDQNIQTNGVNMQSTSLTGQRNAKLRQSNNANNLITFQFLPSVSYQLENEKDQQEILNTFKINKFENHQEIGKSNKGYQIRNPNQRQDTLVTDVNYSVDHTSARLTQDRYKNNNVLYDGPSSYFAPQAPVNDIKRGPFIQNNNNMRGRLEKFDDIDENNNGYPRVTPARRFSY